MSVEIMTTVTVVHEGSRLRGFTLLQFDEFRRWLRGLNVELLVRETHAAMLADPRLMDGRTEWLELPPDLGFPGRLGRVQSCPPDEGECVGVWAGRDSVFVSLIDWPAFLSELDAVSVLLVSPVTETFRFDTHENRFVSLTQAAPASPPDPFVEVSTVTTPAARAP